MRQLAAVRPTDTAVFLTPHVYVTGEPLPSPNLETIAIGGTSELELEQTLYRMGRPFDQPYSQPFAAETDTSTIHVKGIVAPIVHLEGKLTMAAAPVDRVSPVPTLPAEMIPAGTDIAFTPTGEVSFALLAADGTRLVDSSLTFASPIGAPLQWDSVQFSSVTPGTYEATVNAAGTSTNVPIVVIDHADALAAIDPPPTISSGIAAAVCFAATFQSMYVSGLDWTYQIDGLTTAPARYMSNCT